MKPTNNASVSCFNHVVGIVDDNRCDLHLQTLDHPEAPDRVIAVRNKLKATGLMDKLYQIPAREVTDLELQMVHTNSYIQHVRDVCCTQKSGFISQDADMFVADGPKSYTSARVAAGGVIEATKHVVYGSCMHAYCNVRPPGHHAYAGAGGGFCIFNNVALGVMEALKSPKINRVAIFDWDLHHGDGTADIFKDDPYVLFISVHRSAPYYPGTGMVSDNTESVINYPVDHKFSAGEYIELFDDKIFPEIESFDPDLIFISCGIDAHIDDPMQELCLSESQYTYMTYRFKMMNKPIICVLEGGYNTDAVANSVHGVVEMLTI